MPQFKRVYLMVLIVLVGIATTATVAAIFLGGRPLLYDSILVSALGVGFMILLSFAALPAMERRGLQWIAAVGALLAGINVVVLPVFMIWIDSRRFRGPVAPGDQKLLELAGEVVGTGIVWAAFLCLIAFVYAQRLNVLGRLLQIGTVASMTVATAIFMGLIWADSWSVMRDAETCFLASMVLSVAGVLAVLLLGRFLAVKVPDVLSMVGEVIHLQCPRCKKFQDVPLGSGYCSGCRLRIRVEVEEPRCPKCGYNLHQLTRPICPECGEQLAPEVAAGSGLPGPAAAGEGRGEDAMAGSAKVGGTVAG
ncbi:MAG: hypothetical protein ACTHN5_03090 [Phycisphaerae bacterium]